MRTRILTSAVCLPIMLVVVYYGGLGLQISLLVLSLFGLDEFYGAISKRRTSVHLIGYAFTVAYYVILRDINETSFFFVLILALVLSILTYMVFFYERVSIDDVTVTLFGFFYAVFPLSFVYMVREHVLGEYFVWLIFICSFGSDTFAYFIGRAFGRHKLAVNLSPKKTVEGAIGGAIGAGALAALYGALILHVFNFEDVRIIVYCLIVGAVGAVFSMIGDLSASAIKRLTRIKDFGKLFPGHGGMLDRFDSVIFAAPIVYILMKIIFWSR